MNILIVILAIVVLLLAYYIYTVVTAVPVIGKNIDLTQLPVSVKSSSITNPYSANYTIGVWIYVSNFTSNNKIGTFLVYGKTNDTFFLEMDTNTPDLYCNIKTNKSTAGTTPTPIYQRIKINNASESFPIQSWTYVTVSVSSIFIECYMNGRFVSATKVISDGLYVEGAGTGEAKDAGPAFKFGAKDTVVTRSSTTAGVTTIPATTPTNKRTDGSPIFLTGLSRWDYPLSAGDVYNNYMKGNGYSNIWGSPYHMDVNLKKGTDNYVMNIF
jgi:hypothetical protein